MKKERVSIHEVASAAAVSRSTASRALLGQEGVSQTTRDTVQRVARELGYVRDLRAHALKAGSGRTVVIYVRAVQLSYYGQMASLVQRELDARGYELVVVAGSASQARPVDAVMGLRPAGVIVASGRVDLEEFASLDAPVVVAGSDADHPGLTSVADDNQGIKQLASLTAELGHRVVAVIDFPPGASATLSRRASETAKAHRRAGSEVRLVPCMPEGEVPDPSALRRSIEDGATVIVCPNDPLLVSVWEQLTHLGLTVPEDVSLIGYDGRGELASPVFGLTTWAQPIEAMAAAAASEVVARIVDDGHPCRHLRFRGELVRGRTLAPADRRSSESSSRSTTATTVHGTA
ncbi:LacI family DNA-binding transcriptional regulator [Demetria terragena]|uniref:LacI family DNA-binding transcriptional regulator n=1 Tax=Demetria terragena TaxID=63959 RepID=UPI00037A886D|nr:LacI family DNA-binding transcriptional regulator [Demetria terragena]